MGKTNEGKCLFCDKTFSKVSMKRHLDICKIRTEEYITEYSGISEKYLGIMIQGYENPEYWIYVDMPANSTLKVLDGFLRNIWLECCGHLSLFEIGGQSFSVSPDREFEDRSMSTKLESVLDEGMQFKYEYDFGSTTTLKLKIVSKFYGKKRIKNKVKLLARNHQPNIKCSYCGNQARNVCCECLYEDAGWVCDTCAADHECGEDMFLPVVNSPRVGVCAYNGGSFDG